MNSNIALVHEWLTTYAGSERVVEQMLAVTPAKLHVLVDFLKDDRPEFLRDVEVTTSFLQRVPFASRFYRNLLPLMPLAVEQLDLRGYDLVISSQHCVAHGVLTSPDQLHLSYVHSPVRYAWDLQHEYLAQANLRRGVKSLYARALLHYIRQWDRLAADRVDYFAANSAFIAQRIRRCYRRKARVIHPPVDVERFLPGERREDYYLAASRMVPYKRLPLVVEAFNTMPERKLVVIGDGPQQHQVAELAGPNVEVLGHQPPEELSRYLREARALVFPACEDFGILPVEAQACGTPVIAYGAGGSLETVVDGRTGIHFERQDVSSITSAIERFESLEAHFEPDLIRKHAERFSIERFRRAFLRFIDQATERFHQRHSSQRRRSSQRSRLKPTPLAAESLG
ncbi:D-inositol 3-phosphate glycosyltransferase [Planctomycetes bacterium Pan216]|uniref:D-inositol 3-phosphate glycosyltransferase n=1 Tax=Kolteria novifilia TaxID=2527975 RepID=A0A518B8J5_9BACT|nr:D-inositol 3-phosphate glycosyltransferase [Planctomycetes bacterium Pan216]